METFDMHVMRCQPVAASHKRNWLCNHLSERKWVLLPSMNWMTHRWRKLSEELKSLHDSLLKTLNSFRTLEHKSTVNQKRLFNRLQLLLQNFAQMRLSRV